MLSKQQCPDNMSKAKLDKLEKKIEELDKNKNILIENIKGVSESLEKLKQNIDAREAQHAQQAQQLTKLISLISPVLEACGKLSEDQESLHDRQLRLERVTLQVLENRASETENRLRAKIQELEHKEYLEKSFLGRHWKELAILCVFTGVGAAALFQVQGRPLRILQLDSVQRVLWGVGGSQVL